MNRGGRHDWLSQVTLHRFFALMIALCAGVGIYYHLQFREAQRVEREYYVQHFEPAAKALQRASTAFKDAYRRRQQGETVPLAPLPSREDLAIMRGWSELQKPISSAISGENAAGLGTLGTLLAWVVAARSRRAWRDRCRADPYRPADPGAGREIARLTATREPFTASHRRDLINPPTLDHDIEIDATRQRIVFHGFSFTASFLHNPRRERIDLPFADILGTRMVLRGRHWATEFLEVRTTQGFIELLPGDYTSYDTLSALLADIVEVNRKSPARYREALAREPFKHTPWYGWLIIALALAGAVGWFLMIL